MNMKERITEAAANVAQARQALAVAEQAFDELLEQALGSKATKASRGGGRREARA